MKTRIKIGKSTLLACAITITALVAGYIVEGKQKAHTAEAMTKAAQAFLATLNAEQKAKATYSFSDDQRLDWHFVPQDRKGLPLKEMNDAQRKAAMDLLQVSLSQTGYKKATTIISLEPVLARLEGPNRRFPRDPQLYYVTIFGEPGKGDWGFRFEGHHCSQNFTVVKGKAVVDAPSFFGSNPANVLADIPQKGTRALANEEDLGRQLVTALDEQQRKKAVYDPKAPGDIISLDQKQAKPLDKVGIKASELNSRQYAILEKLVETYISNVPDDVAALRRAKLKSAKKDEILFAWAGPIEKVQAGYKVEAHDMAAMQTAMAPTGFQGHYYRIQAPSFLIEYDNTQNNSNHIHSVWRDFNGDWGRDLLAEHYRETKHDVALLRR